jgi:hypothetical protein
MLGKWIRIYTKYIITASLFVIFAIGFFSVPHVFAETDIDYETILFTDPEGSYSIKLPSDGWSITPVDGYAEAVIKTTDSENVIRIVWSVYTKNPNEDLTDNEILRDIQISHNGLCSGGWWNLTDRFWSWDGCYKFQAIDRETAYTNEGRKLQIVDMQYIIYSQIYSIHAEISDGDDLWSIVARTTAKDSKQTNKFDTENLQKIREIIKSLVILNPNTEPELESEQVETPQTKIQKVPDWVRNIFIWYAEEQISEDELLNAIKFLVNQGIINLDS